MIPAFLIGFQTLSINRKQYAYAGLTSIGIASGSFFLYRIIPNGETSIFEFLAYVLGGPCGILSSMYLYHKFFHRQIK